MFLQKSVLNVFFMVFFAVFSVAIKPAFSHPHAWIDLKTEPIFNDAGNMTGLRQFWLFDDFYSAFVMEDMPKASDGLYDQKALDELARMNLQNLEEYHYFTVIKANEKPLKLGKVTSFKTFMEGNRLAMEFDVPLKTATSPIKELIDYQVYDPGYYIEILHFKSDDAITLPEDGRCVYNLIPPAPPKEMSLLAAGLDRNQIAEDGFGAYFAETVALTCE